MNENKRGRIVVGYRFLMANPESVLRLFSEIGFLPIRVEHDMFCDVVEYAGYSEAFRELSENERIPAYRIMFRAGENREIEKCWVEEVEE